MQQKVMINHQKSALCCEPCRGAGSQRSEAGLYRNNCIESKLRTITVSTHLFT